MKKVVLLALSTMMALSLVACGGNDDKKASETSSALAEVASEEASVEAEVVSEEASAEAGGVADGKFDDFEIIYKGARLGKDFEDKEVVIVTFDFTNLSEASKAFLWETSTKAFQNGVELEDKISGLVEEAKMDNNDKEIKTGITVEVEKAFELSDKTSPIEIEVDPLISLDKDEVYKFEIDPSTLS